MFKKKVGMDNTNSQIQDQLGVPPVPPIPPMGTTPDDGDKKDEPMSMADAMAAELANADVEPIKAEPAPEAPATEADAATATLDALADSMPTAEETPAAAEEAAPAISTTSTDSDLDSVKKSMLKDLFPLLDKVNVTPEQRFRVYHEMIEDSGDKTLITPAYEAAKGIADETARAEALLFLVDQADK